MSPTASASSADRSTPRSSAPSAPEVGRTSNRVLRIPVSLFGSPHPCVADHLGIFFGVRRIKPGKLLSAHRLHRLQRLLLEQLAHPRTFHHFDEPGEDFLHHPTRRGARGRVGVTEI